MNEPSGEDGFSILEILVAFSILSLSVVAYYESVGTSYSALGRVKAQEIAITIGLSRLAEAQATTSGMPRGNFGNLVSWDLRGRSLRKAQGSQSLNLLEYRAVNSAGKPIVTLKTVHVAPNEGP